MCPVGVATLPSNHRQHVSKDGTLTIQAVQRRHDAGEYVCTARNTEEQGMSRSVHVHVMGKLGLILEQDDKELSITLIVVEMYG